ncbi:MAG: HAD-IA family hydrolase [Alphaproteobacteria bacterium]|nr:HAD-IA family hydrolase [Alphaproteobacteria bacterium]
MHVLIDLDNVLLNSFSRKDGQTFFYWTQNLKKDLGVEPKTLGQLFTKDFLLKGPAELYASVNKYLAYNSIPLSADTFVNYWLEHDSNLNTAVWTWVWDNYNLKKHTFHIASDQACLRMDYLLNKFPMWRDVFKKLFTSYSLGVCKNNPLFFQKVLSELGAPADEVCLIDDNRENITIAAQLNIKTILFTDSTVLHQIF